MEQLVVIVDRGDGPGQCVRCQHLVEVDWEVMRAVELGAAMLCQPCSWELALAHPGAFRRA